MNNCLSFSKYDLCDLLFPQSMVDNLVFVLMEGELEFDLSSSPVWLILLHAFNGMYVGKTLTQ